jgi:hypothetical protein
MDSIRINPARRIDHDLANTGNAWHLRRMTDRAHANQSILSVCRQVREGFRAGAMQRILPETRRAIWQIVITQHLANRDLYRRVMRGDLSIPR